MKFKTLFLLAVSILVCFPPFFFVFHSVFFVSCYFPMDAFPHLEYLLLLLEQGHRSLEGHTRLFLQVANHINHQDDPCAERRRPKMALERISPPLWSRYWRETDLHSPSVLKVISPVPFQTQSQAHHHFAARSLSQSPP